MPLDANAVGQAQGGIPGWMLGLHNAIDPVKAMGGYGNLAAMALPVGRAVPMNFKVGTLARSEPGLPGVYGITHKLPSGVSASYQAQQNKTGGLNVSLNFGDRTKPHQGIGLHADTPKQGVDRLKDVYASIEHVVSRLKPEALQFAAGTKRLGRVYDKVAPQMAERFGGNLRAETIGGTRFYEITFPNAQTYPLKK